MSRALISDTPNFFSRLLANPVFNLISTSVTMAGLVAVFLPAFADFTLQGSRTLRSLDRWIMFAFVLEMGIRFLARGWRGWGRLSFFTDLFAIAPLMWEAVLQLCEIASIITPEKSALLLIFPGMYLVKGARVLRLVRSVQFFHLQRQFGLTGGRMASPVKSRFFLGISFFLFLFSMAGGIAMSIMHARITDVQKSVRREMIESQARSYGLLKTYNIFSPLILRVQQTSINENYDVYDIKLNPEYIKSHYRYEEDYIQLDGIVPGGSVQISFRDLNRRQIQLELALLLLQILTIAVLLTSLNYYLDRMVVDPVERATRVLYLRIRGEELESSSIQQEPPTEITALINMTDELYRKMRAPRRLLPDRTVRPAEAEPDEFLIQTEEHTEPEDPAM